MVFEHHLRLTVYLCSQCTRVHNTHYECYRHEITAHSSNVIAQSNFDTVRYDGGVFGQNIGNANRFNDRKQTRFKRSRQSVQEEYPNETFSPVSRLSLHDDDTKNLIGEITNQNDLVIFPAAESLAETRSTVTIVDDFDVTHTPTLMEHDEVESAGEVETTEEPPKPTSNHADIFAKTEIRKRCDSEDRSLSHCTYHQFPYDTKHGVEGRIIFERTADGLRKLKLRATTKAGIEQWACQPCIQVQTKFECNCSEGKNKPLKMGASQHRAHCLKRIPRRYIHRKEGTITTIFGRHMPNCQPYSLLDIAVEHSKRAIQRLARTTFLHLSPTELVDHQRNVINVELAEFYGMMKEHIDEPECAPEIKRIRALRYTLKHAKMMS